MYGTPYGQPSGRRASIGYGSSYGGYAPGLPGTEGGITPEQRDELLGRLEQQSPTFTSNLLWALGKPSSLLMDVLAGKPLNSGSDGEDALKNFGLLPGRKALGGWARPVASVGLEMFTDPLNLVTFGGGSVSKAGRAAKAAGLFDNVQAVASRALLDDSNIQRALRAGQRTGQRYADNALNAFDTKLGKSWDSLTDDDLWSRPLVGSRSASRSTTLEDLVNFKVNRQGGNAAEITKSIDDYLKQFGNTYQDVAKQSLTGDIGVRLPFSDISYTAKIPLLGDIASSRLDKAGQFLRWNAGGRYATSLFSNSVLGTVDEGDQILAKQFKAKADDIGETIGNKRATKMMLDLPEEAFTAKAGAAVRNVIEGTADAAERDLVRNSPGLDAFVARWSNEAKDYIARSREAGIGSSELADKWGTGYFPRSLDEHTYDKASAFASGLNKGGKQYSVTTGDQLARSKSFHVPGGSKTLQELSLDPNVVKAGSATDEDIARYLKSFMKQKVDDLVNEGIYTRTTTRSPRGVIKTEVLNQRGEVIPKFGNQQALALARRLRGISPAAVDAGHPIFGKHFSEDLVRYYKGREKAIARSNILYDVLGSSARLGNPNKIAGGNHIGIQDALRQLKLRTVVDPATGAVEGAKAQILQRLQRLGVSDIEELKNVSVDKRLMERLTRIADFYEAPEAQNMMTKFFDGMTRMWKSSILSWPARFTRDWYSGVFSNLVEVKDASSLWQGYSAAKHLLQGDKAALEGIIKKIPKYSHLTPEQRYREFVTDLSGGGLLQGRQMSEIGQVTQDLASGTAIRDEMIPGLSPRTTLGYQLWDAATLQAPLSSKNAAYSELAGLASPSVLKQQAASAGRMLNILNPSGVVKELDNKEVTNPILRWSAQLGDTTDSINRTSGYVGLLLQGVSPEEAAKRIKWSQVDYNSLTKFEKGFMRRVIPFYSYTSRISGYVGSQIAQDPGGVYTQFGIRVPEKIAENDQGAGYVPASVRQRYGFSLDPLRDTPGIGSIVDAIAPEAEGVSGWLTDIDLPGIDQLNLIKPQMNMDGQARFFPTIFETGKSVAGANLHPWLKTGVEVMTGQDLYTGRPIKDSERTLQAIGRRSGLWDRYSAEDNIAGTADIFAQAIPFAPRVLQLARRAVDSEKVPDPMARAYQNAFNAFTGIKVQNISDDVRRQDALRKINELIADDPSIRTFERTYVPKEAIPYTDPQVLQLYSLLKQLDKEQRLERKAMTQLPSEFQFTY